MLHTAQRRDEKLQRYGHLDQILTALFVEHYIVGMGGHHSYSRSDFAVSSQSQLTRSCYLFSEILNDIYQADIIPTTTS